MDFIGQFYNNNGNAKSWEDTKIDLHLKDTFKIYWLKIIDVLPKTWKDTTGMLKDKGNVKNLVIFDHHIVRNLKFVG